MKIKKFIAAFVSFAMIFTGIFNTTIFADIKNQNNEIIWGDVSGDNILTALDASMILEYVLGRFDFTPEQKKLSRVTGSYDIDIDAASRVLEKVLNSSIEFEPYTGTEQTTDFITEEQTENSTDNTSEIQTEISTDNTSEEQTEISTDNTSEIQTEISTDNTSEIQTEISTDNTSEAQTEISTDNTSEIQTEIFTDNTSEVQTEISTDNTSEEQTDISTENTSEAQTEYSTEGTSEAQTENSTSNNNVSWKFDSDDFNALAQTTIAADGSVSVDGITFINSGKVSINTNSVTYNNVKYTNNISFNGSGSTTKDNISFNVLGPCKITAIVTGGSTERYLQVQPEGSSEKFASNKFMGTDATLLTIDYTGDAGKLYLFSGSSGIKVYSLSIIYDNSSTEESSESTTDSGNEEHSSESTTDSSSEENSSELTTEGNIDISQYSKYSLTGFGSNEITGGGENIDNSNSAYRQVHNPAELEAAIADARNGKVSVIEIMNDLGLGYIESGAAEAGFKYIRKNNVQPINNDELKKVGISTVEFNDKIKNLTIYSKNGAKIKHACLTFKGVQNVILRNIEFDELWEWDEGVINTDGTYNPKQEAGAYDINDWDYITIENSSKNVWIDHCTFNRSYDGMVDVKDASSNVVISWCTFKGDDMSENSFVTRQINQLEEDIKDDIANNVNYVKSKRPFYYYLRTVSKLTPAQIISVAAPQKKAHLIGHSDTDTTMSQLSVTLYNNYYKDIQDRMPRLRGGNAHAFNLLIDNTNIYNIRNNIDEKGLNLIKGMHFSLVNQAFISTCGGAVKAENSHVIEVSSPLSFEQKAEDEEGNYAGKLLAEKIKFQLKGVDYGIIDSTSGIDKFTPTGKGSVMEQFSWNEFDASNNVISDYIKDGNLTYDYEKLLMDLNDIDKFDEEIKTNSGAGKIVMPSYSYWFKTQY